MEAGHFKSEQPIKQKYYSAPQIGLLINEPATVVRFWALEFEVYRKNDGYKWLYPRESVAKFHQIKTLLRVDRFTIIGAKQKLKCNASK